MKTHEKLIVFRELTTSNALLNIYIKNNICLTRFIKASGEVVNGGYELRSGTKPLPEPMLEKI